MVTGNLIRLGKGSLNLLNALDRGERFQRIPTLKDYTVINHNPRINSLGVHNLSGRMFELTPKILSEFKLNKHEAWVVWVLMDSLVIYCDRSAPSSLILGTKFDIGLNFMNILNRRIDQFKVVGDMLHVFLERSYNLYSIDGLEKLVNRFIKPRYVDLLVLFETEGKEYFAEKRPGDNYDKKKPKRKTSWQNHNIKFENFLEKAFLEFEDLEYMLESLMGKNGLRDWEDDVLDILFQKIKKQKQPKENKRKQSYEFDGDNYLLNFENNNNLLNIDLQRLPKLKVDRKGFNIWEEDIKAQRFGMVRSILDTLPSKLYFVFERWNLKLFAFYLSQGGKKAVGEYIAENPELVEFVRRRKKKIVKIEPHKRDRFVNVYFSNRFSVNRIYNTNNDKKREWVEKRKVPKKQKKKYQKKKHSSTDSKNKEKDIVENKSEKSSSEKTEHKTEEQTIKDQNSQAKKKSSKKYKKKKYVLVEAKSETDIERLKEVGKQIVQDLCLDIEPTIETKKKVDIEEGEKEKKLQIDEQIVQLGIQVSKETKNAETEKETDNEEKVKLPEPEDTQEPKDAKDIEIQPVVTSQTDSPVLIIKSPPTKVDSPPNNPTPSATSEKISPYTNVKDELLKKDVNIKLFQSFAGILKKDHSSLFLQSALSRCYDKTTISKKLVGFKSKKTQNSSEDNTDNSPLLISEIIGISSKSDMIWPPMVNKIISHSLGDRVVLVDPLNLDISFGAVGTVIGEYKAEVLLDHACIGATDLKGRVPHFRGAIFQKRKLFNLTRWRKLLLNNKDIGKRTELWEGALDYKSLIERIRNDFNYLKMKR